MYRSGRNLALAVSVSLLGFLIPSGTAHTADAKPSWQMTWENTVAAAKKEGRLNFYVGRYGSEPLLNDPKYADMTPIYQLAKEFMKGREGK